MCSVCLSNPCNSRCPNADEPIPKYLCKECRRGINTGEKYFLTENGRICKECLDDMTPEEILGLVDEKLEIA